MIVLGRSIGLAGLLDRGSTKWSLELSVAVEIKTFGILFDLGLLSCMHFITGPLSPSHPLSFIAAIQSSQR